MTAIAINPNQSYEQSLHRAARVNWRVEDIIGGDKQLDFTRRFLPEALARVDEITCLNTAEKLILNQIRGNSYLHLFGLVEEFIVPSVIDHVKTTGLTDITATQALLHFAEEESKHIRLFRRFAEEFEIGFGSRCDAIGPVQNIASAVLQHRPLGVMLVILYIEWMTQYHYLASIRDNFSESLDPQFCSLLRNHWLEEAQHTTLDTLMVEQLVQRLEPAEREAGVEDFFKLIEFLNGGLMMQAQLDLESLSRAIRRTLTETEQQQIKIVQERSYRWTFVGSGLTHPQFMETFNRVSPAQQARLSKMAEAYCQ
ncbi:hypothetical protein J5X98_02050 [Leptothermofonsia sichuanensis E412]|uniref:hypothetical protein n=1 Tax=Leptothermofonsia sichuanensis TaxID=2917832 RepID=UPI001CA7A211|nr:hypothetical protein [Leptothermofonsia sichuanensis]QZZ21293.1 hypothetical protein J5X98_02050 [Leptothermofonsia sichuanensis E412]